MILGIGLFSAITASITSYLVSTGRQPGEDRGVGQPKNAVIAAVSSENAQRSEILPPTMW